MRELVVFLHAYVEIRGFRETPELRVLRRKKKVWGVRSSTATRNMKHI